MKKRERGEYENGPLQGKRAVGPRGAESSEAAANNHSAANGQRLTTDDALAYLKAVKEKFKDDKEKYDEFLEVMKDFKAQRVDTAGVITRVKDLFKGHRQLILGFNTFLPRGYEITLPLEEDKKQPAVEFDQAINYVNKIKARFQTDEHVYKTFLEILNMYRKGNKSINEVYQEVASLFENHGDLLEEFTYFLPGSTGPPIHAIAKPVHQNPRQRDEKGLGVASKPLNERLLVPKKEKTVVMPGERSRDREAERRADKDSKKSDKEKDRRDIGDRKETTDREEGGRDREKDFAEQKPAKRASARNASDAIRRQSQAGEVGEGFSGSIPQASTEDKKAVKGVIGVQYPFFDKVKARLRSRDTYQEFLKCLNIFCQEIISRDELQSLVGDILGKHADLMEGFTEFLTHCENVEGYLAGVFSGRKLGDFAEGALAKDVKTERDGERERNREKEKERERQRDAIERERDVKPSLAAKEGGHKVVSSKDKYINKPISELDLSNCDRCTPSYRLLPKHYPRPVSSHRTALGNSVLNDSWVSVTSGSEDYSFKHMRKNQYEESLFRCEDDRFELDMLLEGTAVTEKLVGDYITKQEEQNGKAEALPPVDEFLSAINLRCIERIYGDHGLDMLEAVRKNTSRAMPVIHSRLVQKEGEWTRCREEMNKVWSEVYAKNCYKALDHRSFYFRSQDKKALSSKGLLAEIKEVSEKNRREDDTMLAMTAGNRRPLMPDLRYEFSELSIHDDMYQIIKYSSEEISSSPDHTEKTMRMWRMFVEPVLGISSRSQGVEDVEEGVKVKSLEGEGRDGVGGESGESGGGVRSSSEGGDTGLERERTVSRGAEVVGVEESEGRVMAGSTNAAASGGERSVGGSLVVENARAEADDRGSDGVREGMAVEGGEGTAARTEGSGWLRGGSNGAKLSSGATERGEVGARANAGLGENRGSRSVADGGGSVISGNGTGGGGTVDREEGELSPCSEQEERKKPKYSPRRGGEENGAVKLFGGEEEDAEGVGGREMEHEQDADDEGEESAQKSSSGSDTPSEAGEEVSASEQSGDEQSEHEEEEEEEEQEGKAESEGEAEGMTDVDDGDGDGNSSLADSEHSYAHCKPLAAYPGSGAGLVGVSNWRKGGRIFYGNDTFYVLFRLYQTLYERLLSAKVNAELAAKKKGGDGGSPPNLYSRFMQVLYGLLDGSVDNSKFEDECRAIIGTQSYILFTLDKLIFKLVKQLQAAATDDVVQKLLALNAYENGREAVDAVYYADTCVVLHDENIYRFEQRSNPSELLVQLMEHSEAPGNSLESSFQKYLDGFLTSVPSGKRGQVFCVRNLKRMRVEDGADYGNDVNILNELEIKMSCRTSKVSYVLDTEDVFWRSVPGGKRRKVTAESKRRGQFHKWMQEMEGVRGA